MLPKIKNIPLKLVKSERFHGISNSADGPSHFLTLKNAYPFKKHFIETAPNSSLLRLCENITGYLESPEKEVYTTADGVHIDGTFIPLSLRAGSKNLIRMGARLIILPDFISVDLENDTHEVTLPPSEQLSGTLYEKNTVSTYPVVRKKKAFYLVADEQAVKQSSFTEGSKGDVYFLMFGGTQKKLPVTVMSFEKRENTPDGKICVNFETDFLYPDVNYLYTKEEETSVSCVNVVFSAALLHKPLPRLDFVVEHRNRLWGCSSRQHEIYCSKLGDPYTWGEFCGISTDPWAATVGSEGDFTAAAVYGDGVVFFKENCLHMIRGTRPENYNITQYPLDGVQKGSSGSVVNLSGLLYYRGGAGVYVFNGASAARLDEMLPEPIGSVSCASGSGNTLLMVSGRTLYLLDTESGDWHTEILPDFTAYSSAFRDKENICLIGRTAGNIFGKYTLHDSETAPTDRTRSFVIETAPIGAGNGLHRYFTALRLYLFADVPEGSTLSYKVYTACGDKEYKKSYEYNGRAGLTELILHPERCDRLTVKISGSVTDDAKLTLKGIYTEYEEGSGYVY